MRLGIKTILYFFLITVILLLVMGFLINRGMNKVVAEEIDEGLKREWEFILPAVEKSKDPEKYDIPRLEIRELHFFHGDETYYFGDTLVYENEIGIEDSAGNEFERYRVMVMNTYINGVPYRVRLYRSSVDQEDMVESILLNVGLVFMFFIIGMLIFQLFVSKRLWQPFYKVLDRIKEFEISKDSSIEFGSSTTSEFQELIGFMEDMSSRARDDYQNLKAFSENASHEIQTPLAILKGKLERLLQSKNLKEEEINLISEAMNSAERLSKLNSALLLLAKIENHQFGDLQMIDLDQVVEKEIDNLRELIELKNIKLIFSDKNPVRINANLDLVKILISNLLSNAIRHNRAGGELEVKLNSTGLQIMNSGAEKALDQKRLFRRFSKQSESKSPGLGLAISSEICKHYQWELTYAFEKGMHVFKLHF